MTGRRFDLRDYALDKRGRPIRKPRRQSVSERIRQKRSKRVRVTRRVRGT